MWLVNMNTLSYGDNPDILREHIPDEVGCSVRPAPALCAHSQGLLGEGGEGR